MEKKQEGGELEKMVLNYDVKNDNYLDFIGEVRAKARDGDELSHGLPILPLEADANPPYIGVNLQAGGVNKGVAMIRRYDLRLIYFQDMFGHMVNVDDFKLYDKNSKLLDFGIDGFLLGLATLIEALDILSDCSKLKVSDVGTSFLVRCNQKQVTNPQDSSDVQTSLVVLCLVLCEATKFDFLSCLLGKAFKSGLKLTLTSWLLHHINDWDPFSEVLFSDGHSGTPDCNLYLPDAYDSWDDEKRVIGVTCQDIAQSLGILKNFPLDDPMPEDSLKGTCMLEVYSVRVYINGGRSGNVYGSIKIDNGCGTFHIYDRDCSKCEYVESHGTLSLQEPSGFITALGNIDITVDIMEEGGDNLEISKGKLSWGSFLASSLYDTRLSAVVRGKNGYVIVNYSVFKNAIQAHVEGILLRKCPSDCTSHTYDYGTSHTYDGASHICVHGGLTTRYCSFKYEAAYHKKYFQSTLFGKPFVSGELYLQPCTLETCKQGVVVEEEESLELARSRVTVDVESSLIIIADLKNCQGKPIVTGSEEFVPYKFSKFQNYMEGHPDDSHKLFVKVTWEKIVS